MVHAFATLCFALTAMGSALLIWAMLVENRTAIVVALGRVPADRVPPVAGRHIRVRSVRTVTQTVTMRSIQARRAA